VHNTNVQDGRLINSAPKTSKIVTALCRPNQNLPAGALCKYVGVRIVRHSGAHPTNFVPMYWIVSSRWLAESILVEGNNYARMKYLLGLYLKPIWHLDKEK